MVAYYLSRYTGTGTRADPFRPGVNTPPPWSAIDLRPNPAVATGYCFVALPSAATGTLLTGSINLGTGAALSTATRNSLSTALGVTVTQTALGAAIAQVLIDLAGGARWKPVVARRSSGTARQEIYLAGLLWSKVV